MWANLFKALTEECSSVRSGLLEKKESKGLTGNLFMKGKFKSDKVYS